MFRVRSLAIACALAPLTLAGGCVHRPPPSADSIGCPGTMVLVIENGTAQNLDVVWYGATLGVAMARQTTRLQTPGGFPCRATGECRGPEFRTPGGGLPEPGPFRQSFGYFIECH